MSFEIEEELRKFYEAEELKEQHEHEQVLLAIRSIIQTPHGRRLFTYLYKNFNVGELPEGLEGNQLFEYLGFLRAGQSIFKITSEADSEISAQILAQLERKKYERIYNEHRIRNGL